MSLPVVQFVLNILMFLGVVCLLPLVSHLRELRRNDIRHLMEAIQRIEDKLDTHLRWHLDHSQ